MVFTFRISANACGKRQSDTQNANSFLPKKNSGLSTNITKSIISEVDLGDGCVDLQGFRHGLRPTTRCSSRTRLRFERRSRSRKNGRGLGICSAQTGFVKDEQGGSAALLQLVREGLFRRQGAGAEEIKRSLGDFLHFFPGDFR